MAKSAPSRVRDVLVLAMGQAVIALDNRHAAAETAERLRQLEADIAAADDQQVAGNVIKLQRLDMRERTGLAQARHGVDFRSRPCVDDHVRAAQHARAAAAERDFNRARRDETAAAEDELRARLVVNVDVHVDQAGDHLAFALAHGAHVDVGIALGDAELRAAEEIRGDLRAVDEILARQARDVGARAADPPALDDGNTLSLAREGPREIFAAFAAAEDNKIVFFR
jgi:hypothetical protein